jgi:CheY-like chemotaxis protein
MQVSKIKPSFLYVEDDMDSRVVMDVLLNTVMGFPDVMMFESSADFEAQLDTLPEIPAVIFLDVQIGPLNGYGMLRILRSDVRFRECVIVAMTANVMSHDVDELKRAGFDGLIGKPIMDDFFPDLVNKILAGESVWFIP